MEFLVNEELVQEETVDDLPSYVVDSNMLELKCLELQYRERERERESQLELRELELCEKELSVQLNP